MTAPSLIFADTRTMLRRNLVHAVRYPLIGFTIGVPIVMLLLFVYAFGGTLGSGISADGAGPASMTEYLQYVVPGIILLAVASAAQMTAMSVARDMSEGIIARFRTMAISRGAVLAGHVYGNVLQQLIAIAAVFGVALLMGYRPLAAFGSWLAAIGVIMLIVIAIAWLSAGMGMQARTVESASNLPMPLILLPFLGSGFVPTDSMPVWLRFFADYQPFTPFIETIRSLLAGQNPGTELLLTFAWCAAITIAGVVWSRMLYERRSLR
ncbi:ABC transporter permease [Microbacterium sp. MPKO10]|uniref:ABC transporter permease n=1 Tax=Microbacterium sp. MPKO10 TaxID=2989818 RepID=UPI002235522C|nr:ABC transporter permease [Microbacterium sp. MPKO10]MCW4456986.1 ABC transporter permease [Microbacterium sp. MPKO10]